jgi:hypothetical protein
MGQSTTLAACPPGLFIHNGILGFKSEYTRQNGTIDAYVVRTGEAFAGPQPQTVDSQRTCLVVPVEASDCFPAATMSQIVDFLAEVRAEFERAIALHPSPNPTLAALTEEVGEVAKALLERRQLSLVTGQIQPGGWAGVRVEAVQVAAMAARIALEGDPTLGVVPEVQS